MAEKAAEKQHQKGVAGKCLDASQTKALFQAQARVEKTGAALAEANGAQKTARTAHKEALDDRNTLLQQLREGQIGMVPA